VVWEHDHRFGSQEAHQHRFHIDNKGQSCFLSYGGIACCDQSSVWNENCRTLSDNDDNYCWHQNDGHGLCLEPERHIVFIVNMWFNRGIFCPLSKRLRGRIWKRQLQVSPSSSNCSFTFEYLPLIDEHNKKRQAVLGLERKWPTQCCWTRLIVTLIGMCVVDMQPLYRSEKKLRNRILCGQILEEDATIVKFSDLL
jgi:hypothetical protein